jgi:hypothetical protein
LRRGWPTGIDGAFVAHRELPEPLVVDAAGGRVLDARSLESPVAWQCSHQVAARILNRIGERGDRVGTSYGRCAPPSCAWRCRSRAASASVSKPTCGAFAPG